MKLYKTERGIIIAKDTQYYLLEDKDWEQYINDDNLLEKVKKDISKARITDQLGKILAPIGQQELWACGVTYQRSKEGRQEESEDGGDIYARVYEADRPEVFFKCTNHRISHPDDPLRIRSDSEWNVPEPELTLVVSSSGKIVGYTIGNDMSSRSIEGENPLYLPQAKTWDGCASLGPCIYLTGQPFPPESKIQLEVERNHRIVFNGEIALDQMKRSFKELVSYVYKECSFPYGCLIMTGTGIVPPADFTLEKGDVIKIRISNIGTLINSVV